MAKFLFLVPSGPASPERTAEYKQWYDDVHIPDVLKVKGVKAASRYRVAPSMGGGTPDGSQFMAIYEVEVDDPQDFYDLPMLRAAQNLKALQKQKALQGPATKRPARNDAAAATHPGPWRGRHSAGRRRTHGSPRQVRG
jgi:hypothetical protein